MPPSNLDPFDNPSGDHSAQPRPSDFLSSVLLAGMLFGFIDFLAGLVFGYMQINSEPGGSLITSGVINGVVVCLVNAFAGLFAIWHYTRHVSSRLRLGQGALIGFLAGAAFVVFSALLKNLWTVIDPDFTRKLLDSMVANLEQMDLPAETRDQLIDQMAAGAQPSSLFAQIFYGIPFTGLLNLFTGMLGVRFFANRVTEYSSDDFTDSETGE